MIEPMRGVVYYAPGDIVVEALPVPLCQDGEIRVAVDACAVCGTDLKSYLYGNPRIKAPLVIGHEFTGIVDRVRSAVGDFVVGDRVVMATSLSCGQCPYCVRGWRNLCRDIAPMGFSYAGGMAEFVTIPARALKNGHVITVPAGTKAEHAAMAEPLSCAINAAENCDIQHGDTVVVIGAGPMGILNACVAREFGAGKIILAEINESRLKRAEAFGFDVLVNPARQDLADVVREQTDGVGADVAIVAAPAIEPQEQALNTVRKRGTVCLFASLPVGRSTLSLDSRIIHYGELRVVGSSDSTPRQVGRAVELLGSGRIPASKLVTHLLSLGEILTAFELMQSGEALRVVLKP